MHFLTNYFDIRNSNDGNYIYITINGKDKKCKTLSDVAKVAYDNSQIVLADAEYDKSESKKKIDELRVQQNMNLKDAFCAQFEIELAEHLEYKKKARDTFINNAIPSAFSAEFTPAKFRATEFYNEVDLSFISCVVYCEEQDALYYTANNSYKLIGSIDEIIMMGLWFSFQDMGNSGPGALWPQPPRELLGTAQPSAFPGVVCWHCHNKIFWGLQPQKSMLV